MRKFCRQKIANYNIISNLFLYHFQAKNGIGAVSKRCYIVLRERYNIWEVSLWRYVEDSLNIEPCNQCNSSLLICWFCEESYWSSLILWMEYLMRILGLSWIKDKQRWWSKSNLINANTKSSLHELDNCILLENWKSIKIWTASSNGEALKVHAKRKLAFILYLVSLVSLLLILKLFHLNDFNQSHALKRFLSQLVLKRHQQGKGNLHE